MLGRRQGHGAHRPGDLQRAEDAKLARSTCAHALIVTPAEASVKAQLYQRSTGLLDAPATAANAASSGRSSDGLRVRPRRRLELDALRARGCLADRRRPAGVDPPRRGT